MHYIIYVFLFFFYWRKSRSWKAYNNRNNKIV